MRNVANIISPYESYEGYRHHSTSAALEFAIYYLQVKYFIILGHNQCVGHNECGRLQALLNSENKRKRFYYPLGFVN
ncbi:carbonic anhydrase [Coxiella-like endosymbiont]|uniref:carbonic anhydrase n=1 Tax=Coxiella-like endosymbiont TaxID=1592897 RepID=UPI00272B8A9A|nr:carbonic anhydrase [Coxiella-like endosymbiont]